MKEVSTEVMEHLSPGELPPSTGLHSALKSNPLKMTFVLEKGRRWRECESLRAGEVSSLLPRAC